MDLIDRLTKIAERIPKQLEHIQTEEATKNAFVMPFINALGYDVFDPVQVIPEFTADVGKKKGEKVDYALMVDGKPAILVECKNAHSNLDGDHAQLFRYFTATTAKVGILTNGIKYRLFTDLEEPNKMDERPFLEFDLTEINDVLASELKKLSRDSFDAETMVGAATELKFTREIKGILREQMANPSEEFVRFFGARVYSGRMTAQVMAQFTDITKRALGQFIQEEFSARLEPVLGVQTTASKTEGMTSDIAEDLGVDSDGIVTTQEEIDGYHMVKAIVAEIVDPERVAIRDTKSYCGILLDDNNRKPICRMHFNSSTVKYLGLFDAEKKETRIKLIEIRDVFKHSVALKAGVQRFLDAEEANRISSETGT